MLAEIFSNDLLPDVGSLTAQVDAVLKEDLYWFPVRHHSAAVARHVGQTIRQRRPKVVFIEGPTEAQELIPFVVDKATRPPIAIFSSYRDDDNVLGLAGVCSPSPEIPARFSCWYPLVAYSPEYIAMQAAQEVGAKVVFIDLPHHALIKSRQQREEEAQQRDQTPNEDVAEPTTPPTPNEDSLIASSGFYQRLAAVAGYKSWDEAWDSIFEISESSLEDFRRELATFCAAARATSDAERIRTDGTLERERHFLKTIRETLSSQNVKACEAVVICGGFHLFLDRTDATPPPVLPEGTVYTTVMPYSYFRISELSGYGAGNRAPQFYQTLWELTEAGCTDSLVAEHSIDVLKRVRRAGHGTSSADAIAIHQHAGMLAGLRGRRTPILDDIQDAIISCCCKGNPDDEGLPLRKAIDEANIGTKIGKVTTKLGHLPIVNDFFSQVSDLDLGESIGHERLVKLELDKRQAVDDRRSVFLHRLRFLEVPFASLTESHTTELASGLLFRERWSVKWNPKVEPHLIEQTLLGESIEAAVFCRLREQLAATAQQAGETCGALRRATDMDLPNLILELQAACGVAIDADPRFASLAEAVGHLMVLDRYAVYRNINRTELNDLLVRGFDRACFALPDVACAPPEQHDEIISGLKSLAELLLRGGRDDLDRAVFTSHVQTAANDSTVPFLRGAFVGLLAEMREISSDELARQISAFALTNPERMVEAGDFIDGVMSVSRTSIMLGAEVLTAAIDELLRAANWDVFLTMLPRLRAAFERLHDRQVDSLAGAVARQYGLANEESAALTELNTSVGAALLIANIDHKVSEIMQRWQF
jgi:hypothetical protein